jgi:dethiobiotin synthetase
MPPRFVISATGTDVGKTLTAATLMLGLRASYWKPIQCGSVPETDTEALQKLTQLLPGHFLKEKYFFKAALSPHRAAEIEEKEIDIDALEVPACDNILLIEGAGGVMVPVSRKHLFIDVFAKWQIPLILCARTELGTINHTLLSIEALKARKVPIHGLVFLGIDNADTMKTIAQFSGTRILGHIPPLATINIDTLNDVFTQRFDPAMFAA